MTRLVASELLKLCATRFAYVLLAAVAVLTAVFTALNASATAGSGQAGYGPLDSAAGLTSVITITTGLGHVLAAVLGATIASGEYRTTATATYLATPHRGRVLMAKLIVGAAAGLLVGAVTAGVATAVGLAFVVAKGLAVALPATTIVWYGVGAALAAALLAALGVGLGSLVRRQVAVVVGVFIWALGLEQIIGTLVLRVARYLPFIAAGSMAGRPISEQVGSLSFGATVALLVALATAVALTASRTTLRRDIA